MSKYILFLSVLLSAGNLGAQLADVKERCHLLIEENKQYIPVIDSISNQSDTLIKKLKASFAVTDKYIDDFSLDIINLKKLNGITHDAHREIRQCTSVNNTSSANLTGIKRTFALYDSVYFEIVRLGVVYEAFSYNKDRFNESRSILLAADKYLKLKSQNEDSLVRYEKKLLKAKKELSWARDQLICMKSISDNSSQIMTELFRQMKVLADKEGVNVKKALEAEKKKYAEKGPEGFSEAYYFVFPDVHPGSLKLVPPPPPESASSSGSYAAPSKKTNEIVEVPDNPAEFPGGREALTDYLDTKMKQNMKTLDKKVSGKVYLKFVVLSTGHVSDIRVIKGIEGCPECSDLARDTVHNMPDWIPATMKEGEKVNSYFMLPVQFGK